MATCLLALLLAGCGEALVYSEGTNISLASITVNDNIAEPLSVNFGLKRTVATIAPHRGNDDEAVNMVSGFKYDNEDAFLGTLSITTEFASGKAALTLAKQNSEAAIRIMNIDFVEPDSDELRKRRENAINYIEGTTESDKINAIAGRMGVADEREDNKEAVIAALKRAENISVFNDYARIIKDELGNPF